MKENYMEIRPLNADEIECRIGTIQENGLSLLLFKDARVDQKILDEIFTPFGWKRSHQAIEGNLYCTVEIWDPEKGQWIAKQDVGTRSYTEQEKGQASDSFKRACFNWGIGRELYTAPFIWIPAEQAVIQKKEGRFITHERYRLRSISYNHEKVIIGLTIENSRGEMVYAWKRGRASAGNEQKGLSEKQLRILEQELARTGVPLTQVLNRYGVADVRDMDDETFQRAMRALKRAADRAA